MTTEDLIKIHEETCAAAREMMLAKNHDYAGGSEDRFANFRGSLFLGIEPELGILMRVMDKFMRITAFIRTGCLLVKGEAVEDAIEDSINYLILLKGMIIERRTK